MSEPTINLSKQDYGLFYDILVDFIIGNGGYYQVNWHDFALRCNDRKPMIIEYGQDKMQPGMLTLYVREINKEKKE